MGADGWVIRLAADGDGPRVAVKDAIDVAGLPTHVGSPAVARTARPAADDAACVAAVRTAGGVIVGKTAATELCWFANGLNVHEPPPINPLDATRIPGGSSSGSAVVVARGEADVALGTDTGGSVRVPAACCGVVGLKTTWGRISLDGVWPLAPSLDSVGVLARDVAAAALGLRLLDHASTPATISEPIVVRLRTTIAVEPIVDIAVDAALATAGWKVREVQASWWPEADDLARIVLTGEGARANTHLLDRPELLSPRVRENIAEGLAITDAELRAGRRRLVPFWERFIEVMGDAQAVALPTLRFLPPPIEASAGTTLLTNTANLAGLPALALPIPVDGSRLPGSIQLVGRSGAEEVLLALGGLLEECGASVSPYG